MQNNMQNSYTVLMLGDLVGEPGRRLFEKHLPILKDKYKPSLVIANGENSANGKGITTKIMSWFKELGVDVVTSGNHIFDKNDIYGYLDSNKDLLRPANFPSQAPGTGMTIVKKGATNFGIINLQGRVFMKQQISCPFKEIDSLLTYLKHHANIILVDFHAETTSEKLAMAYYLDGRVSAVCGTHTHVQTADERILPAGTAYITDLGMAGSLNSMIGMQKEPLIKSMISQMPVKFEVQDEPPFVMSGVAITIGSNGKASKIERIYIVDTN